MPPGAEQAIPGFAVSSGDSWQFWVLLKLLKYLFGNICIFFRVLKQIIVFIFQWRRDFDDVSYI